MDPRRVFIGKEVNAPFSSKLENREEVIVNPSVKPPAKRGTGKSQRNR
jgi:hypothetical protein